MGARPGRTDPSRALAAARCAWSCGSATGPVLRCALGPDGVRLHDLRRVAGAIAAATVASTKELTHRLGHASPRAALRYQHATAKRDEAIADGIDRILDAAQHEAGGDVLRFRDRATGEEPAIS